jgi:putative ABC transport system permease protein
MRCGVDSSCQPVGKECFLQSLKQAAALIIFGIISLPQRIGQSAVIILGVAGVVAMLLTVLGISGSLQRVIAGSGRPDRALVLRTGAKSEGQSALTREDIAAIETAPGIARVDGKPKVSPELLTQYLVQTAQGLRAEVVIRGVDPEAAVARPEIKIIEGRFMRPGLHEVIVGKHARAQYPELDLRRQISISGAPWSIVGIFDSGGGSHNSEVFADSESLMSAIHRNSYNSLLAVLDSPGAFQQFKDFLTTNPSISVEAYREPEYYLLQSESVLQAWAFVAYVVGGIMALGAMIGAANTMYSSVAVRSIEIATLRAVGFRPDAVVIAILTEALLLAVLGAVLGTAVVWLLFNGHAISTKVGAGRVITQLRLAPSLILLGMIWAIAISIVGGIFPAVRAARLPVVEALRED